MGATEISRQLEIQQEANSPFGEQRVQAREFKAA